MNKLTLYCQRPGKFAENPLRVQKVLDKFSKAHYNRRRLRLALFVETPQRLAQSKKILPEPAKKT